MAEPNEVDHKSSQGYMGRFSSYVSSFVSTPSASSGQTQHTSANPSHHNSRDISPNVQAHHTTNYRNLSENSRHTDPHQNVAPNVNQQYNAYSDADASTQQHQLTDYSLTANNHSGHEKLTTDQELLGNGRNLHNPHNYNRQNGHTSRQTAQEDPVVRGIQQTQTHSTYQPRGTQSFHGRRGQHSQRQHYHGRNNQDFAPNNDAASVQRRE